MTLLDPGKPFKNDGAKQYKIWLEAEDVEALKRIAVENNRFDYQELANIIREPLRKALRSK